MSLALVAPTFSVLVPTWRRPEVLGRCLAALAQQTRRPGQVVVTVRRDDAGTWAELDRITADFAAAGVLVETVAVEPGPLTVAMNAGLQRTTGDLVALTDDDAEPWPDWLQRLEATMGDPSVGGAGGRDWQPHERWDEPTVGVVSGYGRVVGNHHLGAGPVRDVDLLKGVNACFRGDLLRRIAFDRRLRGRGNVTHWELSLCLAVRRAGWRLVYDPAIGVDHRPAGRHDGDVNARGGFEPDSFADAVHNETLAVLEHLPAWRRPAFLAWAAAVGTGAEPGVAQIGRLIGRGRTAHLRQRWQATVRGRLMGVRTFLTRQRSGVGSTVKDAAAAIGGSR